MLKQLIILYFPNLKFTFESMKHSLSYYVTLFVIKLKGVKKDFSTNPIAYQKIRKEDVYRPKGFFYDKKNISRFSVENSEITQIEQVENSIKLLIFIHGGAFVSGPTQLHWDAIKQIFKKTDHNIWMCNYPKAPEHTISMISKEIDAIYAHALEKFDAKNITLIGDSVGGTLITALTQRLIQQWKALPRKLILVCPVFDATFSNPEIDAIEKTDVILSKCGVLSAKKMCTENNNLTDEKISPINGSFKNFPETTFFLATNDITYPDQKRVLEIMTTDQVDFKVYKGENMPHIWPYLPVMSEAKKALNAIIEAVNH